MKPPICEVCGGRARATVRFADYEPLPQGMTGHPRGLGWFCWLHIRAARARSGGSLSDSLAVSRRRVLLGLLAAWSLLTAVSAALTMWADSPAIDRRWLVYLCKPLTTLMILALAARPRGLTFPSYRNPILVGLAFSALGDVFLMVPADLFLFGLLSFAVTHVFYLLAFKADVRFAEVRWPFVVLGAVGAGVVGWLWAGIPAALKLPVIGYVGLLVSMAAQATSRARVLATTSARVAAVGAVLFLLSDATLSIEAFGPGFTGSRATVLATYFVGQWLIALSVELYHSE